MINGWSCFSYLIYDVYWLVHFYRSMECEAVFSFIFSHDELWLTKKRKTVSFSWFKLDRWHFLRSCCLQRAKWMIYCLIFCWHQNRMLLIRREVLVLCFINAQRRTNLNPSTVNYILVVRLGATRSMSSVWILCQMFSKKTFICN